MKKTLKEIAEGKGKQLFIESYTHTVKVEDIEKFTTPKLVESADGASFKARGVIKGVDISRYTENLNKRVYSKQLWENVKKKKMGEGSFSLMGHPEDEGNPQNICGVWHGLEIGESTPTSNLYMVGDNGSLMLEALEAGGKIGFSSVGFGELMEDGVTVNPNNFELERVGDWVLTPSQQVYATKENIPESYKKEDATASLEENFTNKGNNNIDINEVKTMDKIQEGTLKNQVRIAIKEAKDNENIAEAIMDLQEVQETVPTELKETHSKLDVVIAGLQEKLDNELVESKTKLSEKESENHDLKTKLDESTKQVEELTEKCTKLEAIVEKLNVEEIDEDKASKLAEDVQIAKENITLMEADLKQFEIDTEKRDYDISCLVEDREVMQSDIDRLVEEREEAAKTLSEKDELVAELEEKYNDILAHVRQLESELESELNIEVEKYVEKACDKKKESDDEDMDDEEDMSDTEGDDKEKDEKKEASDDDKDIKKDVDDKENSGQGEEGEEKKEKKKESVDVNSDVTDFYDKMVKEIPSISDIKEEILTAKSLMEAVEVIESFTKGGKSDEKIIKVSESKKDKRRPGFLNNRI
jgi:hypothetical protein